MIPKLPPIYLNYNLFAKADTLKQGSHKNALKLIYLLDLILKREVEGIMKQSVF